jgi:hypothetical protein
LGIGTFQADFLPKTSDIEEENPAYFNKTHFPYEKDRLVGFDGVYALRTARPRSN